MWSATKKCQVVENERCCGEVEQDTGWACRCEEKVRQREGVRQCGQFSEEKDTEKKKVPR